MYICSQTGAKEENIFTETFNNPRKYSCIYTTNRTRAYALKQQDNYSSWIGCCIFIKVNIAKNIKRKEDKNTHLNELGRKQLNELVNASRYCLGKFWVTRVFSLL